MIRQLKISSLAVLFVVAACGGSDESDQVEVAETKAQTVEKAAPLEISWEQLMPKGEEDKLAELYSSYYTELEEKFQEDIAKADAEGSQADADAEASVLASIFEEGSANDTMEQIGTFNVVEELDGKTVRIPGYVVPFDFNSESSYQEFLLVPYFGACLHTPPPPPNQIVLVKALPAATIKDINEPVWVEGVLKTGRFDSELANSAYELALDKVEAYAY